MSIASISRRTFLFGSVVTASALAFGFYKYQEDYDNPLNDIDDNAAVLSPYVLITAQRIHIIVPRAEMGQGVMTTLAAMVAEELDVRMEQVTVLHGPASQAYYNAAIFEDAVPFAQANTSTMANAARRAMHIPAKFIAMQITGGSSSTPDAYDKMRAAGAAARQALLQAAATRWQQPVDKLRTQQGVIHSEDGNTISYQQLAAASPTISLSNRVELKPKQQWQLLGRSLPRVDMVDKCLGRAVFGIDVDQPDCLKAIVISNPHLGAPLRAYNDTDARKMHGVKEIIPLPNGLAVVASNTWYAMQAAKTLVTDWAEAPYPLTTEDMRDQLEASFSEAFEDDTPQNKGDVDTAMQRGRRIGASYHVPFLAHSTMEPMNATAIFDGTTLQVWAGTQAPTEAQKLAAKLANIDIDHVQIHTTLLGGGFGRRAELDAIEYAVRVALARPKTMLKCTWTREQDIRHDMYRPMASAKFQASLRGDTILGIDLQVCASSVLASQMGRLGMTTLGPDPTLSQGAWDQPYHIEHFRVRSYRAKETLPVGSWRSVGHSQNGFFHESMMDEIAHFTDVDPLEFRLRHIEHGPSQSVLEAVRIISRWQQPLPQGQARGVAFVMSFGVPTAQVIEIRQTPLGIKVDKVYAAVDVGIALDPQNIKAQVMSGIIYGLTAAIMGEITVADGQVTQSNFHDYPALRMAQTPDIETIVLENGPKITGIGEPGTPPAAPALANALFALTGQRFRELPLNKHIRFA